MTDLNLQNDINLIKRKLSFLDDNIKGLNKFVVELDIKIRRIQETQMTHHNQIYDQFGKRVRG